MLKDYCASCREPIKNNLRYYKTYGNYCKGCNAKCDYLSQLRTQLKQSNNPTIINSSGKSEKNKARIVEMLTRLKQWNLGLDYVLNSQKEIDAIQQLIK